MTFNPEPARQVLASKVDELAELWAAVSAQVRDAVDVECGGLVPALDALVDAASEVDEEPEVTTEEYGEAVHQLDAAQSANERIRELAEQAQKDASLGYGTVGDLAGDILRVLDEEVA